MASQRTTRVLSFSLAIGTVIACVLLAEIALQIIGKPSAAVSGWRFRGGPSETNQLGFRGQPIRYGSDDFVVVLLGDSQVAAHACAVEWMPERRLQHYLNSNGTTGSKNVKVFTIGTEGYGQDQQLLLMQEFYRTYRADMVVLWETPGNDVWNNMFPTHWPIKNGWPKPTFRLMNNDLIGPTENMGDPVKPTNWKLVALLDRVVPIFDRDGDWEKHLPEPYVPTTNHQGPVCTDWQDRYADDIGSMRNENLQTEKTHLAMSLIPVSKRTQYGLELTKKLLSEIEKTVSKNGGRFVVFNTDEPQDQGYNQPECKGSEVVHHLNNKYYKTSRNQYWENVKHMNDGLVSVTIPVRVSAWRRGPDDGHLNEHAVDQVMQDLGEKLRDKL
jgi:hypothetical protein